MKERTTDSRKAFTLIEVLAVIGIIVVLVGLVMSGAGFAARAADKNRAKSQIEILLMALDRYNAAFTQYPTNWSVGSSATRTGAFSNMVFFVPDLLRLPLQTNHSLSPVQVEVLDPWGNPIHYRFIRRHMCELRSFGPDGLSNTVDDIISSRGD